MLFKKKILFVLLLIISMSLFAEEGNKNLFPDFTLDTPTGEEIALSETCAEGPVIITFWATWCKPCIKELRKLNEMDDLFEPRKLTLIAISEDGPRTKARVRPFMIKESWDFTVVLDTDGKVKSDAGVADIPELFMLGTDREILYHHTGYKPGDEAEYAEKIIELFAPVEIETEETDVEE